MDIDIAALEGIPTWLSRGREPLAEEVVGDQRIRDGRRPLEWGRNGLDGIQGSAGRGWRFVGPRLGVSAFRPAVVYRCTGILVEERRKIAVDIGDVLGRVSREVDDERR